MLTLFRIIKFAFVSFWRNIWLSIVTISIITLSFLSINFFILANVTVDTSIKAIENKVSITANFKTTTQEYDILELKKKVEQMPEVASVEYISKQAAFERMKQRYKDNGAITDSLDELESNPLYASLQIRTKKVEDYPVIMQVLDQAQYSDIIEKKNFDNYQDLITKFSKGKGQVEKVGLVINIFFIIIASLIVFNTIRITIYTRKEEIGVMKLVGATNWFIRAPLILESVIYSFIAVFLTILVIYPCLGVIQPYTDKIFDGQVFDVLGYFSNNFAVIFGSQLAASIIINVISSSMAIGRYLKV